ncbi:MAG: hypothetical protein R3315_11290 [Woeseiaceae bacterium]|nr:hypothetical protein [Woeseiaceae bacterium]
MAEDRGTRIRHNAVYRALRVQGASRETAARTANARAVDLSPSQNGSRQSPYEEWNHDERYERPRGLGINGRADMDESSHIDALRNH